jgi:hypothetical protein
MTYYEFERMACWELYEKWYDEPSEQLRQEILSRRRKCRAFWLSIGRNVPDDISFD